MARRLLACACALVAVFTLLGMVREPAKGSVPVIVAAHTITVGERLTPGSVRLATYPADLAPAGAVGSLDEVVGQAAAAPLGVGEPLTRDRFVASGLGGALPSGLVAVHVPLSDPGAIAMLRPGDRLDLVGPGGVVAREVLVVRAGDEASASPGGLVPAAGSLGIGPDGPPGIIIAAGQAAAEAIAGVPPDALGRPALTPLLRSR